MDFAVSKLFLSLSMLCTVVSGTLRHFDHQPAAVQAALQTAPPPAAHPSFRVRVVGQGRALLLLAGLGCSGAVWDQTVAHYSKNYQCHVGSLAGFAGNAPIAGLPIASTRQELLACVRQQQLQKTVVVGHSLGGFLALAAEAPAQFGQVVVLDALPFGAAAAQPELTEAQVRQAGPSPDALGQQFAALPPTQFAQVQRRLLAPAVTDTARLRQLLTERLQSDPATLGGALAEMLQTDLRP